MPRVEDRRWRSLWRPVQEIKPAPKLLSPWPIAGLPYCGARVCEPPSVQELDGVRRCLCRGSPMEDANWIKTTARRLGIESTLRSRGRREIRPVQKTQNNDVLTRFLTPACE